MNAVEYGNLVDTTLEVVDKLSTTTYKLRAEFLACVAGALAAKSTPEEMETMAHVLVRLNPDVACALCDQLDNNIHAELN